LGDVTYLEGEEGEDGRSSRASTPAEATRRMLEKRGFSRKINYRLLDALYGDEGTQEVSKAKAESESRTSRSQSIVSRRSHSIEPTPLGPTTAKPAVKVIPEAPPNDSNLSEEILGPVTEEILGPVTESDRPVGPEAVDEDEDEEYEEEEDAGDEYDEGDDPDGIEAAFSGNYNYGDDYYDEGSDYD